MTKPICLGDITSGGGTVIRCQMAGTHRIAGRPVAVVGDIATCLMHRGQYAFVEGDTQRRLQSMPVVLEGHRLACGCHAIAGAATHVAVG
ncbi:PAAR domain-containing protein [Stenotrophomonas terrae]|uniref:PAAR domain-containing protein n=1 Tax=Stenotrophomonas terrae TaxID=405446 RepID=UPI003D362E08